MLLYLTQSLTIVGAKLSEALAKFLRIPKACIPTSRLIGHISTVMIAASVIIIVITMIHIWYYFIIEGFWVKPCNYKKSLELQQGTCNAFLLRPSAPAPN